jgi:hypothetical protein
LGILVKDKVVCKQQYLTAEDELDTLSSNIEYCKVKAWNPIPCNKI